MFLSSSVYQERRRQLASLIGKGLILLPGNNEAPCNYPANAYTFRQDSSFLYFFAQEREGLAGVIDADSGEDYLFGDDISLEDIIWTGFVPSVADLAAEAGIRKHGSLKDLSSMIEKALRQGRPIHFLPPYRHDTMIQIADWLDIHPLQTKAAASIPLIKAVVDMRAVKSDEEIEEIERAIHIGYQMHTAAMKACRPGVTEKYIGGLMEGIACGQGCKVSFPSIVTMHGEIFHGNPSLRPLEAGRLMLCDAGVETVHNYCSDHTRVTPVSGKFTTRQREIYSIVEACHDLTIEKAKPGLKWMDMHLDVCRLMTDKLKEIGLMKGDTEEAVRTGAHAMFLQHGLGHMMGMDVHDMENLGQIHVGFDDEVRPSTQFGTDCLRCGRRIQKGWVLTDEPGIYFIPALIELWKSEKRHAEFINYDMLESYRDFGGIRIEDDLLITENGCRVLGMERIPYHPDELEAFLAE